MVVLNTSNQQYFLLDRQIKNAEDMVQFINNILDGTVEVSPLLPIQRDFLKGGGQGETSSLPFLWFWKEESSPGVRGSAPHLAAHTSQSHILGHIEGSSVEEAAHGWKCLFHGCVEDGFGGHREWEVPLPFGVGLWTLRGLQGSELSQY